MPLQLWGSPFLWKQLWAPSSCSRTGSVPGTAQMLTKGVPHFLQCAFLHSSCNQSYRPVLPQCHCHDCWTVFVPNSCTPPTAHSTFHIPPGGLCYEQLFKEGKYLGMNPLLFQTEKLVAKGYMWLAWVLQLLKTSAVVKTFFSQLDC